MQYLIILLIILITKPCYSAQKVFYDPTRPTWACVDVSNKKTKADIIKEYNLLCEEKELQEITIDENEESYTIKNEILEKHNFKIEQDTLKAEEEAKRLTIENALKIKLNLTDEELNVLKGQ